MAKKHVPLTVPQEKKDVYLENYEAATRKNDRLFLFAGDQKIEHLNNAILADHLFAIASRAPIGAFATQLGLIAHHADEHRDINYVVKLNSKTNLVSTDQKDPMSPLLHLVSDVVEFAQQTDLSIVGVGYTVYLGSEYEAEMLHEAAQVVYEAHQNGLLAILWMYPRGKAVANERDATLVAGAAGVGACLGADFVKVMQPDGELEPVVAAAGRTGVLCSGGKKQNQETFIKELEEQIAQGCAGCAVGRNIHELDLDSAVALSERIAKILVGEK